MYYSHFDVPESKDCRILFNQIQPLMWLRCLHSPSSECDYEICQKNSMVSQSKIEFCGNMKPDACSNYVHCSLYSTFTQCLECLGAELTTMKCIVGVQTNNPRTPRPFSSCLLWDCGSVSPQNQDGNSSPQNDAVSK